MTNNPFWKYLGFLSLVMFISLIAIYQVDIFKKDILLSIIGLVFMIAATSGFYFAAQKAITSTNKMAFIQLVMGNVFFKMVFVMGIVAAYFKIAKPQTKYFIIPYMSIYFIFTIFETIYVYKLSNKNK